jgi:hypothetical protein
MIVIHRDSGEDTKSLRSSKVTNIYLASIRFGILQYLCNTLYKSQRIPAVLGFLPKSE